MEMMEEMASYSSDNPLWTSGPYHTGIYCLNLALSIGTPDVKESLYHPYQECKMD